MAAAAEFPSPGADPTVKQLAFRKVEVEVTIPYRPLRVDDFLVCVGEKIRVQLQAAAFVFFLHVKGKMLTPFHTVCCSTDKSIIEQQQIHHCLLGITATHKRGYLWRT